MDDCYIYVSHSWAYNSTYTDLISLLRNRGYFNFKNYSIEKSDPLEITNNSNYRARLKEGIKNQMRVCQVFLVIAGKYVTYSSSIQLEIEVAVELNKPIIAIRPYGASQISSIAENAADRLVNWNSDSIVSAIREFK